MKSNRTAPQQFFTSLQILRGIAALLVVIYHLIDAERIYGNGPRFLGGISSEGNAGVDLFFVISGFVVTSIATTLESSPRNALLFLYRRAARILPMYWVFTTAIVAMIVLVPQTMDASFHAKSKLASYLLWPQQQKPLLQVGWTLIYEAYFYIVMASAIAILHTAKWLPRYLATWALVVFICQFLQPQNPQQQILVSPLALEFIIGGYVGLFWRKLPGNLARPIAMLGAIGFIGGMYVFSREASGSLLRVATYGLASGMIVLGLVAAENRGTPTDRNPVVSILIAIGNSSYSLYLSHLFVITIMARCWGHSGLNNTMFQHLSFIAANIATSCLLAWACYRLLERRMTLWLEGLLDRPKLAP